MKSYWHQSTTACCPRETIPDSCSCLEGCMCQCQDCDCPYGPCPECGSHFPCDCADNSYSVNLDRDSE